MIASTTTEPRSESIRLLDPVETASPSEDARFRFLADDPTAAIARIKALEAERDDLKLALTKSEADHRETDLKLRQVLAAKADATPSDVRLLRKEVAQLRPFVHAAHAVAASLEAHDPEDEALYACRLALKTLSYPQGIDKNRSPQNALDWIRRWIAETNAINVVTWNEPMIAGPYDVDTEIEIAIADPELRENGALICEESYEWTESVDSGDWNDDGPILRDVAMKATLTRDDMKHGLVVYRLEIAG